MRQAIGAVIGSPGLFVYFSNAVFCVASESEYPDDLQDITGGIDTATLNSNSGGRIIDHAVSGVDSPVIDV